MEKQKAAVVLGAGGFIGGHLVNRLKSEGYYVKGVDIKLPEYREVGPNGVDADEFVVGDLRDPGVAKQAAIINATGEVADEVYQLAADMGGCAFIFTGENDADIMHNSATINLNILDALKQSKVKKVFYSSSACIYPEYNQVDPNNPNCSEASAYPANPDSEYGWEKLFSERLYLAYARNYGLNVRIARFHNIMGPFGTWNGGREKAPAAICRKVATVEDGGTIDIYGDGFQTRSFLYITTCIEGIRQLMQSSFVGPVNIGSDEMVTINELVTKVAKIAKKTVNVNHISGPTGVRGRNSDNNLIFEKLGWKPDTKLDDGLAITYKWIVEQIASSRIK